ncbi:MAG: 50S ribosomal protein L25 [Candidatus Magasanikbacteria bacterium]|nr:50S ribosomal protein L25 [Candidatus Magasanikbacteria bacterium]
MPNLVLKAEKRNEIKNQVKKVRVAGKIPAVLYGHGFDNQNLSLENLNFERVYSQSGGSLVDLSIAGEAPLKVLIQDFQLDPLTNRFTHVDLRQVKMTEKIKTDIKLAFAGESPAVKGLGATFVKSFSEVPVECLPQDLVSEIKVDTASLKEFGDVIHIKDIVPPSGIRILAHAEDVVATVIETKEEKEDAPAAAPVIDLSQIKTEAEEKREKKAVEEKVEAEE